MASPGLAAKRLLFPNASHQFITRIGDGANLEEHILYYQCPMLRPKPIDTLSFEAKTTQFPQAMRPLHHILGRKKTSFVWTS